MSAAAIKQDGIKQHGFNQERLMQVLLAPVVGAGLAELAEGDRVRTGFGQEVAAVAEHVRRGTVDDSDLRRQVDDDHRPLHGGQNLPGRVLGSQIDELVSPDRMSSHDDKGEHGQKAKRRHIDAG